MDSQINRRELIKSLVGTPVVSSIGVGGLLTLLANRQAVAANTEIPITGVTTETGNRGNAPGEPHRHTFTGIFTVQSINPDNGIILGSISGETQLVISTGDEEEDFHVHEISAGGIVIGHEIWTAIGDFHRHRLSVD